MFLENVIRDAVTYTEHAKNYMEVAPQNPARRGRMRALEERVCESGSHGLDRGSDFLLRRSEHPSVCYGDPRQHVISSVERHCCEDAVHERPKSRADGAAGDHRERNEGHGRRVLRDA